MSDLRQRTALAARAAGILPIVERLRFLKSVLTTLHSNSSFRRSLPDYIFPPLWLAYDAYSNLDFEHIFQEGKDQASRIVEGIHTSLPDRAHGQPVKILDWGCGPGRVIQHVKRAFGPDAHIFGTDYNGQTIAWCRSALPGIAFAQNDLVPPLPFQAGSMDAIYSISVFTHLSEEMHLAWIHELARVLRPGGVLLITVHGNLSSRSLTQIEREEFDAGKLVIRGNVLEGSRLYAAFQPDTFVSEVLLKEFIVLRKIEPFAPMMRQTLWIAQKR